MRATHALVAAACFAAMTTTVSVMPLRGPHLASRLAQDSSASLQWLVDYRGQDTSRLHGDKRFEPFLRENLPDVRVSFWGDKPLPEVASEYLGGPPDPVRVEEDRYVSAGACVYRFGPAKGLLWVDLGQPRPLVVFAALHQPWDTPTVWIISRTALTPETLPKPLLAAIARWITEDKKAVFLEPVRLSGVEVADPAGRIRTISPSALGLPSVR
jgi:hypothetical protein